MTKGSLQQLNDDIKLQHDYWESLGPEERRASFMQTRDAQAKNAQKYTVFLAIVGITFSALTISSWLIEYKMSIMSSVGVVGGVILAIVGFRYIRANRITSNIKVRSDGFTDEDIIAYFREHETINKKALEQWNRKGKYWVFVFGGILMLLLYFHSTQELAFMALGSGISVFLIGLVVFSVIENGKYRNH